MKKVKKYIIVFVLFVLIMCAILVYFMFRKENIKMINDGKYLLSYINTLDSGEYELKNGIVYTSNGNITDDQYFFNGNGKINKDEYGNVSFKINYNNVCIYKNSLGNVRLSDNCPKDVEFNIEIVRNNDTVSFISNISNLYYKVSTEEDFSGEWIKSKGKNVIISSYKSGTNYIWFKDNDGNLSKSYKFNVECLTTNGEEYDKNIYYCIGSKVTLDNKKWLILESRSEYTVLMLAESLLDRLPMCSSEESELCYYTNDSKNSYTWEKSLVNNYLNNDFMNELSNETQASLVLSDICNVYEDHGCDEDKGCGGYLKERIERKNYECNDYIQSKIRIITYEEYDNVYKNVKNMKDFVGNYWILNSYSKDYASTVEAKGNVFILEKPTNKKEVRPVIILSK